MEWVNLSDNSDYFIFENQFLALYYFPEAFSINFFRSVKYGMGVITTSVLHLLYEAGIIRSKVFK
ncbi:MAG: hypothetical protein ABIN89_15390 [Chitinophagaceae bacterium]